MIILTILFLVFLLMTIVWLVRSEADCDFLVGILFMCFMVSFIGGLEIIDSHSDDLAIVRTSEEAIKIHERAIEQVDRQMKDLSIPNASLMNADSPYHSLIELRGERIEALSRAHITILNSKRNIISRKIGIWSRDIVWLLGDK